jgi:hypothetical protein
MNIHEAMLEPEELIFIVILTSGEKALSHQRGLTIQMQQTVESRWC